MYACLVYELIKPRTHVNMLIAITVTFLELMLGSNKIYVTVEIFAKISKYCKFIIRTEIVVVLAFQV